MKKKLFFVIGVTLLLMAGTVIMACSSKDDVVTPEVPENGHGTRQLPKQADFIKTVTDIGYIRCDKEDNTWYIEAPYNGPDIRYDGGAMYYLFDLPEDYQKEKLKVRVVLDCYTFRHFDEKVEITIYAGYDYYDAVLKQVEVVE